MGNYRNILAMVLCGMMLAACTAQEIGTMTGLELNRINNTLAPAPMFMRNTPEDEDSFSQGFRDGCSSYLGFVGSGMLRLRPFKYDVNRSLQDQLYARGFREGASYCLYYTDTRPN